MNKRHALRTLAAGAGALLGLHLSGCTEAKPTFNAVDMTGADYAKNFALTDADGKARTLADFKGKVVVLFFGYAQCPDVCPTTMTEMAQVKQKLGKDGDKLQVLFVTVDPERDTPAVLKQFVGAFHPRTIGLTGSPEAIAATAKSYAVYFKKGEVTSNGGYMMDHSRVAYLMSPEGKPLALLPSEGTPQAIATEMKRWVH